MTKSALRASTSRVALIATCAVAFIVVVCEVVGWPFLRTYVERAIQAASGVPVVVDKPFRMNLIWKPGIQAGRLVVSPAPAFDDLPHLLDANDVHLRWRWLDLWRWQRGGQLVVRALSAERLDARLVRIDEAHASWSIGPQSDRITGEESAAKAIQVDALQLSKGRIVVDDAPADLSMEVDVGLADGAVGDAERGFRATAAGEWGGRKLEASATANRLLPLVSFSSNDGTGNEPAALRVVARLGATQASFDGNATALVGARALNGQLSLSGRSLSDVGEIVGASIPHTPAYSLDGELRLAQGQARLTLSDARVGESRLRGELQIDQGASPPLLTGDIEGRLVLTDLGPAVGTDEPPRASDRILPDRRLDLPSLQSLEIDVGIDIDTLDLGTSTLAPMRDLRGRVVLQDGVLRFDSLHAEAVGGRFSGAIEIDSTAEPPRWHAALRMVGLELGRWIRVGDENESGSNAYVDGELQAAVDVTGFGRSSKEVLGSLGGRAAARVNDGSASHLVTELIGLDVAQALGVAISGDQRLSLNCARMRAKIGDGVIEPLAVRVDNEDTTLDVGGRISLADEEIGLRAKASPKDFSLISLRTPVLVAGTFKDPEIGFEGSDLAPRLLAVAGLAVVAPIAAWVPLLDPGEAGEPELCTFQAFDKSGQQQGSGPSSKRPTALENL